MTLTRNSLQSLNPSFEVSAHETSIDANPPVARSSRRRKTALAAGRHGAPTLHARDERHHRLEDGIQRKDRKIIHDAQLSLNGTIKFIQNQLCYEYSPIRAKRDNPDLWDVVCFSRSE